MQRAIIDDVADLAGVSIKTVSRVVNREPNYATRAKVESSIAERAALVLIGNAQEDSPLQGAEIVPATIEIRESTGPAPR